MIEIIVTQRVQRLSTRTPGRVVNRGAREAWEAQSVDGAWRFERLEDTGTPWLVTHRDFPGWSYMAGTLKACARYAEAQLKLDLEHYAARWDAVRLDRLEHSGWSSRDTPGEVNPQGATMSATTIDLETMPYDELVQLGKAEHAAVKAAKAAGEPAPLTPALDAASKRFAAGERVSGRKAKTSTAKAAAKPVQQYFKDGRPMPQSQNKISSLAWFFTKNIEGDKPRIGTADFVALLGKLGAADVLGGSWDVTLPNGIRLSARVAGDVTPVDSTAKPAKPAAKQTAKKAPAARKEVTPIPKTTAPKRARSSARKTA